MAGLSDWQSDLDQAKAGLRDVAGTLASYVKDLEEAGFTRSEAIRIAIGWQAAVISAPKAEE